MRTRKKLLSLGLALAMLTIYTVAPVAAIGNAISGGVGPDVQAQIDELLKNYELALQQELQTGTTALEHDSALGTHKILTGASQAKMDALWQETVRQIDELSARPAQERQKAISLIQSVEPGEVTYLSRGRTPYDLNAQLERYRTNQHIYSVDTATSEIVQIRLVDERHINAEPRFSKDQLESKARDFIARVSDQINLDQLTPAFGEKEETYFFFRWEDQSKRLADGSVPFVQVGFSRSGDLLNYVNTLPLAKGDLSTNDSLPEWAEFLGVGTAEAAFSEIYANGGSYWAWERQDASYSTADNAGYCYYAGWCSPKNFYYAASAQGTFWSVPLRGRWSANPNQSSDASAYIPSTHATAWACYGVWYNGGASSTGGTQCINMAIWFNTMVEFGGSPWYNISKIVLPNTSEVAYKEVAWDEVWVYDHN